MKQITLQQNQLFTDVILAECGTLEAAMAVMLANKLSITTLPLPGDVLLIPDDVVKDEAAVAYLQQGGIVLATRGLL